MRTRIPYEMQDVNIEHDAIDEYFECITACSLGDDGIQCVSQCIEVHLKEEAKNDYDKSLIN